jgi:hypothetical protein
MGRPTTHVGSLATRVTLVGRPTSHSEENTMGCPTILVGFFSHSRELSGTSHTVHENIQVGRPTHHSPSVKWDVPHLMLRSSSWDVPLHLRFFSHPGEPSGTSHALP